MTDFNDKMKDPELRRLIQRLPQRQVGPEFTARVMDEALRSLKTDPATSSSSSSSRKWATRLLGWFSGWKEEEGKGSFPLAPLLGRVAFVACAMMGIGFLVIYKTSETSPSSFPSSASKSAGPELSAVSREVAALESVFHDLDNFSAHEDLAEGSFDSQAEVVGDGIPWIQDFESIQAISSKAAGPDEELLHLLSGSTH